MPEILFLNEVVTNSTGDKILYNEKILWRITCQNIIVLLSCKLSVSLLLGCLKEQTEQKHNMYFYYIFYEIGLFSEIIYMYQNPGSK